MLSQNARIFLTSLFEHKQRKERLRTTFLAEKLEITKAAITDISRTLRDEGYINYEPYQPYELTETGEKLAQQLFYRICIIEKYFFCQFKLLPYRAKIEAINAEPGLSDLIIKKMETQTPAPEISLFGHPLREALSYPTALLNQCEPEMVVKPIAIKPVAEQYQSSLWEELATLLGKYILINHFDREVEAIQFIINNEQRHISLKLANKVIVAVDQSPKL